MKKVYIASNLTSAPRLHDEVLARFAEKNIHVTGRWLTESRERVYETNLAAKCNTAIINIQDIEAADSVVCDVLDGPKAGSGGKHFEVGYAYGRGREIFIIGDTANTMFYQPGIRHFNSWNEFFTEILP